VKKSVWFVIGFAFLLSACDSSASDLSAALVPAETTNAIRPTYTEYSPRSLNFSHGAILFFATTDDPFSVSHDQLLQRLYASGSVSVPTYRVDFGSATGARLRYGVVIEDTFILLDASGERVGAYTHPSPEDIAILVQGRIPVPPSL